MIKKILLVMIGAFVVISAIASRLETPAGQTSVSTPRDSQTASPPTASVPDHIVYGFLFRNVSRNATRNNERNRELQAKGITEQKSYFPLKREVDFTDEQSRTLSEITAECEIEVKQQDHKAQLIIGEFRSKLPDSKVPPPPPPVLKTMWDERNAMILRARDRLQSALGGEAFNRLDNFARFRYGTNKAPISIRPIRTPSK